MNIEYWKKRYDFYTKKNEMHKIVGNRKVSLKDYESRAKKHHKTFYEFLEKGESILDFGCGIGRFKKLLCSYYKNYFGTDIVQSISSKHFIPICKGVIKTKKKFDGIFSCVVMQHITDNKELETYFKQFDKLLNKGGALYLYEKISLKKPRKYTHIKCVYMKSRLLSDYVNLCKKYFIIEKINSEKMGYVFIKAKKK